MNLRRLLSFHLRLDSPIQSFPIEFYDTGILMYSPYNSIPHILKMICLKTVVCHPFISKNLSVSTSLDNLYHIIIEVDRQERDVPEASFLYLVEITILYEDFKAMPEYIR